jgi:hypothetical protein
MKKNLGVYKMDVTKKIVGNILGPQQRTKKRVTRKLKRRAYDLDIEEGPFKTEAEAKRYVRGMKVWQIPTDDISIDKRQNGWYVVGNVSEM